MRTGTLSPTHVDCARAACHYLTDAPFSFKNSHWYNQIREVHTCFCAKFQMSTPLLKDRRWLFAHMFYMSIPRPDLRGFSFSFFRRIYIFVRSTYAYAKKRLKIRVIIINQSGSCTLRPLRPIPGCFPLHRQQISSDTISSPLSSTVTKT